MIPLTKILARVVRAFLNPNDWVEELSRTIDDRKGRMEDYALLLHKSSEHLLPVLVAERYLSVDSIYRRAPKFEGCAGNTERYVTMFLCTQTETF